MPRRCGVMALGNYEKVTIDGIVKNKEDFYYEDFSLPRRKYTDDELIEYLLNTVIKGYLVVKK